MPHIGCVALPLVRLCSLPQLEGSAVSDQFAEMFAPGFVVGIAVREGGDHLAAGIDAAGEVADFGVVGGGFGCAES